MPRRSAAQVSDARAQTLEAAAAVAGVRGLEGLTIGTLAEELGMSKSGLVGRFGSKQDLQLAVLRLAARAFRRDVYEPALEAPPGIERLRAICDAWIAYLEDPPFPGGCFLTSASVEFDAQPGPVNEAVRETIQLWLGALEREARRAELDDPRYVAFTINALAVGANCDFQLHGDARSLERAHRAMEAVLAA